MLQNMLPKNKQKSIAEWLILFILVWSFAWALLTELLQLPIAVMFCIDIAWFFLALLILKNGKELLRASNPVKRMLFVALLFLLSTLVGLALQYQSILYYLWGLRNNMCFFVFLFACILFLKAEDAADCLKWFDILFLINFLVTLFQFFVLGYEQDYLGGIFGVQGGCNRITNAFMMIVVICSVVRYLNQEENVWMCLAKCAAALLVAALAELKMFILEFVAILLLAVLFTKLSRRKIILLIGGFAGAILAVQLLTYIFPGWKGWFSPSRIWETATSAAGYNGHGVEVNRLTAIPIAWSTYLTTWPQKLFGLGLGHCDYSSFSFLTTPFYTEHGHILYAWFQSGFLMLETGLVGVVLYCAFFVVTFFAAHSLERSGKGCAVYCQISKLMSVMCLALLLYNDTLRTYVAYMVFFTLALPFLKSRKEQA